jgi:hypothetical protein
MQVIKENKASWKLLYDSKSKRYMDWDGDKVIYTWDAVTHERSSYPAEQKENFIFEAELALEHAYRGRSAAGFVFKDVKTDQVFTMRMQKVEEFLKAIPEGRVTITDRGFVGHFTFYKQGANYSIGLVKK